jgi:hypothetical protein
MKPPVEVVHLFPVVDEKLIGLLKTLSDEQWQLPTLAKQWVVKDVAAHLLDGNIRTISAHHSHAGPATPAMHSYHDLVDYLNRINADWVTAMQRVSPQLLVEMLEITGLQYSGIMAQALMFEPARFSVAWAGEETSFNWFHIAREYTEKVHHQLQIRHATGHEDALMTPTLFYPFIDTLMYGLPHALRGTAAPESTTIAITITGESGGDWFAQMTGQKWTRLRANTAPIAARVVIEPAIAWKLFTKGLSPEQAVNSISMEGDKTLCQAVLRMVAVMA